MPVSGNEPSYDLVLKGGRVIDERNGIDVRDQQVVGSPTDPTITLDIEIGVGEIEVTH